LQDLIECADTIKLAPVGNKARQSNFVFRGADRLCYAAGKIPLLQSVSNAPKGRYIGYINSQFVLEFHCPEK